MGIHALADVYAEFKDLGIDVALASCKSRLNTGLVKKAEQPTFDIVKIL